MSIKEDLLKRSNSKCELCTKEDELTIYEVSPSDGSIERSIIICSQCQNEIKNPSNTDHWRCLNETMWSETPAIQVVTYRILKSIAHEGWPQDLLDMLYLEDDVKTWAEDDINNQNETQKPTLDSNGITLKSGDSVTIIKDLDVKGAGFTAKRGTVVKNIALTNNPQQIEGRVNNTRIVLLSKFLKKV